MSLISQKICFKFTKNNLLLNMNFYKLVWMTILFCFAPYAQAQSEKPFILAENGIAKAVIVCMPDAGKVAKFAASELKYYLDKSTGASFMIVNKKPVSGSMILVGDSSESRKLGISVKDLKCDGFFLKRLDNGFIIAGRDDKNFDISKILNRNPSPAKPRSLLFGNERATLFAVYEFLEQTIGLRWYFPGEYGEYVPIKQKLIIPEKLKQKHEPCFMFRYSYISSGRKGSKYFSDYSKIGFTNADINLWLLRNKRSSQFFPANHMPSHAKFKERFAGHPEYFALTKAGKRDNKRKRYHLCYSNDNLLDEISKDVEAFFGDQASTSRGLNAWNGNISYGDYYSLLPNDSFGGCFCKDCIKKRNETTKWSELVWGYVATVARRVSKTYPNKYITCLCYPPYNEIPKTINLPGNVMVGLSLYGPALADDHKSFAWQKDVIEKWRDFSHKKVFLWTYNCLELYNRDTLAGIPKLQLHATKKFYNSLKGDIVGSFYENHFMYGFQHHLDLYVFHKVLWNPEIDIEELIDGYCRHLYGPAAGQLKAMLKKFEDSWMKEISYPIYQERHKRYWLKTVSPNEIYEKAYNLKKMKELKSLMKNALSVTKNTKYAKNVTFFEKWFFQPFENQIMKLRNKVKIKAYCDKFKRPPVIDGRPREKLWRAYQKERYIKMKPIKTDKKGKYLIQTFSRTGWDDNNFYMYLNCYENPDIVKHINRRSYAHDDTSMCERDSIELFIAPKGLQDYYQFIISPSGAFSDIKCRRGGGKLDVSWDSKATIKTSFSKRVWRVEIAIPFASLGVKPKIGDEWRANFHRTRGNDVVNKRLYYWSYSGKKFHRPELFGTLIFSGLQYEKK